MSLEEKTGTGKPERKNQSRKARAEQPGMGKGREEKKKENRE